MKKALIFIRWFVALAVMAVLLGSPVPGAGSDTPVPKKSEGKKIELPDNLTKEEIYSLLATMSDSEVRQALLDRLLKEEAKRKADTDKAAIAEESLEHRIGRLGQLFRYMFSGFDLLPNDLSLAYNKITDGRGLGRLFALLGGVLAILAFGLLVEFYYRWRTAGYRRHCEETEPESPVQKFKLVIGRLLLDLGKLVIFTVALLLPLLLFYPDRGPSYLFTAMLLYMVVRIRIIQMVLVLFLSPRNPGLRFIQMKEGTAVYLYKWTMAFIIVWVLGSQICRLLNAQAISEPAFLLLASLSTMIMVVVLIIGTFGNRKRMLKEAIVAGDQEQEKVTRMSAATITASHMAFLVYLLIVWGFWQVTFLIGNEGLRNSAIISLIIVPFYFILDGLGVRFLNTVFTRKPAPVEEAVIEEEDLEETEAEDEETDEIPAEEKAGEEYVVAERRTSHYLAVIRKIYRVILFFVMIWLFTRFWGLELPAYGTLTKGLVNTFITLLLAYLAWEFIKASVEKKIASDAAAAQARAKEEGGFTSRKREHTLLPLLRKIVGVVLAITAVLIILSSFGVDIGPLLASAGVFGLAIGLGSQALVRDVVSGFFFLMDDAFRVGDYIIVGNEEGFVESLSLRTLTLRHYKGQLQVIPYGGVKSVINMSRGPMLVKFNLALPADTSPNKVKKIIKKINAEMMEDPEFGNDIVEPIKSQGVKSIEDGVMTIRVKFRAKPGTQFVIRREAFSRIHKALVKKGIHFASRGVTVNVPGAAEQAAATEAPPPQDQQPATESVVSAGAAAAAAILAGDEAGKKKKKK